MNIPKHYLGENVKMGKDVKIWHFAYVGDGVRLGDNVSVGSLAHVDYNVVVGDNTRIGGSVYIPPLSVIGKNVFIGPGVTITNDPYPMSKKMRGVVIEDDAVVGGGSVIKAGVRIGAGSVVGMGAVVVKDVPDRTVVVGNPARPLYGREVFDRKKELWEADEGVGAELANVCAEKGCGQRRKGDGGSKSVMLFAYDFPHKKTVDFIFRLMVEGHRIEYVIGAPWKKLSIPPPSIRLVPTNEGLLHPRDICARFGIKYYGLDHNSKESIEIIKKHQVDYYIISGARILSQEVISAADHRIINIHPGLLPEVRGLDTLLWSIHYDVPLGITAHYISNKIDCGRMICKERLALRTDDTPIDVSLRLLEKQSDVMIRAIDALEEKPAETLTNLDLDAQTYNKKMTADQEHKAISRFDRWLHTHSK